MKTLKEVATEIYEVGLSPDYMRGLGLPWLELKIGAYAEALVREALTDDIRTGVALGEVISGETRRAKFDAAMTKIKGDARNEALEEAAKVADDWERRENAFVDGTTGGFQAAASADCAQSIAEEIRALAKP